MERELDDIDHRVAGHYRSLRLREAQVARILEAAEAAQASGSQGGHADAVVGRIGPGQPGVLAGQVARRLAWAAVLVLCVSLGAVAAQQWQSARAETDLLAAYARQVAMAQHAQLPVEFTSSSNAESDFDGLCDKLDKLNFEPVAPVRLVGHGYKVVGVRYCSVGTTMAAQFRLECPAGRPVTLYQFVDGTSLIDAEVQTVRAGDMNVQIWREGGVVMAMADGTP
ncbi:MAG: hypothetical protein ACFCVE_13470 [Phycisphaerae bacterium]